MKRREKRILRHLISAGLAAAVALLPFAGPLAVESQAAGSVTYTLQENVTERAYPESRHNYGNREKSSYYYSVPDADCLKLVFNADTSFEDGFDYLTIYSVKDDTDFQVGKYTGTALSGAEVVVPGDQVKLYLESDEDERDYGFKLDAIYSGVCSGHSYDGGVVSQKSNCVHGGLTKFTCETCGNYYYEPIPALSPDLQHTPGEWTVTSQPNCIYDGSRKATCTVCGETIYETIPKLSETGEHTYDFADVHTGSGSGVYLTCKTCGYQWNSSSNGTCGTNLTWHVFEFNGEKTLLIRGSGLMNSFSESGSNAAPWGRAIDKVYILDGAESIGSYAFYQGRVRSLQMPDSVKYIGACSFYGCHLGMTHLPEALTEINEMAFYNSSVDIDAIPAGVRTIGRGAFSGSQVSSVVLPDRAEGDMLTLGVGAFQNDKALAHLDLGTGPLTLQTSAFAYCESIPEIIVPEDVTLWSEVFMYCKGAERVEIRIPEIPSNTFEGCYALRDVDLVNTEIIRVGAFSSTTSLKEIVFPETVTLLDGTVFNMQIATGNAPALEKATFLNRTTGISDYAFQYASELSEICGIDCSTAAAWARRHEIPFTAISHADHVTDPADEGTVTAEPTCTEPGVLSRTCTICGDEVTEEIAALGHDYGDWEVVTEPGCETAGQRHQVCERCGDEITEEIAALGHSYGEWEVVTEPGCEEPGLRHQVCERCGDEITEEIAATGHDWGEWTVVRPAAEGVEGLEQRVCHKCDHVEERAIAALPKDQNLQADATVYKVSVGKTVKIPVTSANPDAVLEFRSSDKTFATVNAATGVVRGRKAGTVTVTVFSPGNEEYKAATLTVTIKVVPSASKSLLLTNLASGIKLKWEKVAGATGYIVYRDGTKIKTITSGSTVTFTDKQAVTNGKRYVYKIVAKGSAGNSTLSRSAAVYRLSRPEISSLTSSAATKMTVKWKRNSKATGYQIQYCLAKDFKTGAKTVRITNNTTVSKTIGSLLKGKKYYVRLRSYRTAGSKTFTSAWSAVKAVTAKK